MNYRIYPPEEMIEASVRLPLSKSISNRALIMDALTPGNPQTVVAKCDDTVAMRQAIADLKAGAKEINVGPAGTAMRFFTAYAAATPGASVVLDGNERMRQRPIGPLVEALRACGAQIEYVDKEGYPPLSITGAQLHGGDMEIDASVSSQFISAIAIVAPTFDSPLRLKLKGQTSSVPYIKMTLDMMEKRGIAAELYDNVVTIEPGQYQPCDIPVERDWSAASYWYELTAVSAGWITLEDMSLQSIQGDADCVKIFEKIGVITEPEDGNLALNPSPEVFSRLDLDLSDNPDLVQTLAVTCCLLGVPFHFTGLHSLRIKETDRLKALQLELGKLSYLTVIEPNDDLVWQMGRLPIPAILPIDTHGDHRMAMAFAPAAIFRPGLMIKDVDVVTKSYPTYWDDLRSVGFTLKEA